MATTCRHPVILPLSQGDSPEASAADIYEWTDGRCANLDTWVETGRALQGLQASHNTLL